MSALERKTKPFPIFSPVKIFFKAKFKASTPLRYLPLPTQSQSPSFASVSFRHPVPLFLLFGTLHFSPVKNCLYTMSPYFTQISVIPRRQGTSPQFLQFQILTRSLSPSPGPTSPHSLSFNPPPFKFTFLYFFLIPEKGVPHSA